MFKITIAAKKRETLVVNIFGAPSSGKSSTASYIFSQLKKHNISCELVTEYAKDLVWEERDLTFLNEVYIFAKQHQRMFRLNGKVDVMVTDRPLLLTAYYNLRYGGDRFKELNPLVYEQSRQYKNYNIYLTRGNDDKFQPEGRNETEKEALEIDKEMKEIIFKEHPDTKEINGFSEQEIEETIREIIKMV